MRGVSQVQVPGCDGVVGFAIPSQPVGYCNSIINKDTYLTIKHPRTGQSR